MRELYCGIDMGTSSTKAVVYDEALRPRFETVRAYDFVVQQRDRAELDPADVFGAVAESLRACIQAAGRLGAPLACAAFSSALHSFMAVDADGKPLTHYITWADMRGTEFNAALSACCRGELYARTGCPGNAIYMPAKILWLQKYRPAVADTHPRYVSIKEYVLWRLTGEWLSDFGVASGGGLLNLHTHQWDPGLLEYLGLSARQLATLADGPTVVRMHRPAVAEMGADIPLVLGSGDGQLANLGAGTYRSGRVVATIGSSGAVRVFVPRPTLDPRQRTWCYRLDGRTCVAGGAVNNGGIVLKWLVENFFQDELRQVRNQKAEAYRLLEEHAGGVPAGSRGLLFLPFLSGERSPDWNSAARGLIVGLDLSHSKTELARAAMEGVVMRLFTNFQVLQELVGDADSVTVNGGFTQSPVWLQIMADIFDKPLLLYANSGDSTLGAVIMGLKALGRVGEYDQVDLDLKLERTIRPDARNVDGYRESHRLFEAVYAANSGFFEDLRHLRETKW